MDKSEIDEAVRVEWEHAEPEARKAVIAWAETQPVPVVVLTNRLVCAAFAAGWRLSRTALKGAKEKADG